MGVLNAIDLPKGVRRADLTLCLIALKVYKPPLSEKQKDWCSAWASRVRSSIEAGESDHLRDPAYDKLLAVLFPEMAAGLSKPLGKRPASSSVPTGAYWSEFNRHELPERRQATFMKRQPEAAAAVGCLQWPAPEYLVSGPLAEGTGLGGLEEGQSRVGYGLTWE